MRVLFMSAALCSLAFAGAAHAQGRGDALSAADVNGDGAVTRAEAEAGRAALFDQLDANNDGALSDDERRAGQRRREARLMSRADGNGDGRISRADVKKALPTMSRKEAALADIFFKFVDNRDFKKGATVTAKDITRAIDYAKTHMIAKYDVNSNGLSKDEVAKMSLTGQRAVDLAKALKKTAAAAE